MFDNVSSVHSGIVSSHSGEAFLNVIERHSAPASQNIPVKPHYKKTGMLSPQYDLGITSNHSVFLQAIRTNDLVTIDYFLHPDNHFRGKKKLGREAVYEATLQGNSDLVEQILARGVHYKRVDLHELPQAIQSSLVYANKNKIDPDYARIEHLLIHHAGKKRDNNIG